MNRILTIIAILILLGIGVKVWTESETNHETNERIIQKGKANIFGLKPESPIEGKALFEESLDGLHVVVQIQNAPPGKHGVHIHEYGDLSNSGEDAGGHYNPENAPHGHIVSTQSFFEAHPGDFGNIEIDANGNGTLDVFIPNLRLAGGKYNVAGRALILHEKEDDFSQPTGNAGGRIAGGTIYLTK
jgi:Cu-Zn family superoxide dismutase